MALGDRGEAVREEQRRLNDLGANPPLTVDGIWGPKTQAAFEKLGSPDGGSTTSTESSSDLILPGNAQLWLNETSGEYWVIYEVPGVTLPDGTTSDPVFTAWLVESDEDLEAIVGPGVTPVPYFTGSEDDFTDKGVIDLGGVDELRVSDLEGDPFDTWVEDMTTLAAVQPWILDDDYIALVVQAALERTDGQLSLEEIQGTTWWKDNTVGQRAWMETFFGDPSTAEQMLNDNRVSMKVRLAEAGIANATDELVNWMADRTTMGVWSASTLDAQVSALSDPYSVDVIDDDLFEFLATMSYTVDTTKEGEDEVRNELRRWLGPMHSKWTDEEIAAKAGELRNDPDGMINFVESLKDQRMALYPEHTDRELSYEAIASPWRTYSQSMWGQPIDDEDDVFQSVLKANDSKEAAVMLRTAGLERGYEKTVRDVKDGLQSSMKKNVRGAV